MGTRRELSQINTVVIHCADTPNGRANTIEDIDAWHKARGFSRNAGIKPEHQPHLQHVGYHFVIEVDGAVRPGRPIEESGAHVAGHNHNTIGICLIGRDQFTQAQWDALETLVRAMLMPDVIEMGLEIGMVRGHYEFDPGKRCPCFDVPAWQVNDYRPDPAHILLENEQ